MPPGDRLARLTCGVLPRGNMPYFFVRRSCGQFSLVRSTAPTKMHNKKRVLIVEDNPDLSRVLTRAFRARNLEVVSVSDPDAALKAASNLPPDYAVVDLRLGGHSGLNLIGPLLVVNPVTRILILTGYASIATAVDSIKLGATQYMAKPAHVEDIALALGIDSAGGVMQPRMRRHGLEEVWSSSNGNRSSVHCAPLAATSRKRRVSWVCTGAPCRENWRLAAWWMAGIS